MTHKEYFTESAVRHLGLDYVKIYAGYGGLVPYDEAVDKFIETVTEFEEEHVDEDEIAVVCTYGTNRGGYLICRYLMEMEDMRPREAINTFEMARGQPFPPDKPDLKMDLLSRNWI